MGIIVIGVLIALGAEQIIEAMHWRSEVGELRAAMRVELSADRARTEENLAQDPCMLARLDAIEHWASTASQGARITNPERPFLWNDHSSTWDIAKTSPAATHLGLRERLEYAGAYDSIANEQRYLFDEQQQSWRSSPRHSPAPTSRRAGTSSNTRSRLPAYILRRVTPTRGRCCDDLMHSGSDPIQAASAFP